MPTKRRASPWRLQQYEIHALVTGMRYGEIGLGYHCDYDILVEGLSGGKQWVVDHLASGRAIWAFNAQVRAQFFIEQIAHFTDWNQSIEVLAEQPELWGNVRMAAKAAETWKREEANKLLQLREQFQLMPKEEAQG